MLCSAMRLAVIVIGLACCIQAASAQNFVEGTHYWLEPAEFYGSTPPKDHPRGPQKAKGVVLWNDGYSGSMIAPGKVPPIVQYFAEQGWDAYNLRRHSAFYTQKVSPLVLLGIEKLKAIGYSRIVLMGQSAGAYASIEVGSYRAEITGLLALSPAGFGDYSRSSEWRQNDTYIRTFWDKYKDSNLRVAAGFFSGDDWYETKHPQVRGPYAEKRLTENGIPNFIITEPKYAGMNTHFGGVGWEFARRYGPCLELFFDTGKRPSCEDTDPGMPYLVGIKPPPIPPAGELSFTGQWQGTIALGRFAVLTIPPLSGNQAAATYHLGHGPNAQKASTTPWTMQMHDGQLVSEAGRHEFRSRLADDGTLRITSRNLAIENAPELDFATLHRITERPKPPCLEALVVAQCDDSDPAAALRAGIKPLPVPTKDQSPFTGQWQGIITIGRFAVLTIPPQADGRVTATYQLGQGSYTEKPNDNVWQMRQQDGYLTTTIRNFDFRAYPTNDGRLRITTIKRDDAAAKETDFAMMTRVTARPKISCPETAFIDQCDESDPAMAVRLGIKPLPIPPRDRSTFTGQWQGMNASGRLTVLTIPPQTGDDVNATYQVGRGANGEPPEQSNWKLGMNGDRMVRSGKIAFWISREGEERLIVTYRNNDTADSSEKPFATLQRVTSR